MTAFALRILRMTITVRFFGPAVDLAGTQSASLDLSAGDTVGRVAGVLAERHPKLGAAVGIRLAVNQRFVALSHVLADGDEVAVIPPVSGG